MADVTNPQAIAFAADMRRLAQVLELGYWLGKKLSTDYWAKGMNTLIPNDASVVADGKFPAVTGAQLTLMITRADERTADYEAGSKAKLNTILAVSGLGLTGQ
jgi:hypothetical protein